MHVAGAMTTCVINIAVNDAKERPNLQAIFHCWVTSYFQPCYLLNLNYAILQKALTSAMMETRQIVSMKFFFQEV